MTERELILDRCRKDFKFFLGYCFKHIHKEDNNSKRLIINEPPRIGKTEIITDDGK